MTADDLRALVKRHAEETARLTAYAQKQGISAEEVLSDLSHTDPFCAQDYRDIRDLLSLVRQVADWQAVQSFDDGRGCGYGCVVCCGKDAMRAEDVKHGADCWWLISQGAKP